MSAPNQGSHNKVQTSRPPLPETDGDAHPAGAPRSTTMEERSELLSLLNQRLAEAIDLSSQLKQAHWNVRGPNFIGLHQLFDQVHEANEDYVDQIAERIAQRGGFAEGTVRTAAARSRLSDYPLTISDGLAHVEAVARGLSTFRSEVHNTILEADALGDVETADLLVGIARGLDKWRWFVEAHAQGTR